MNWFSAFAVLLVILSMSNDGCAAGSKKKIRIHVPQKVKHIHHHKKIYITKHVAQPTSFVPKFASSEQYAAGYQLSPSEISSAIAPALALLPTPLNAHIMASPAPNLQPLYRARGHYGPPADMPPPPPTPTPAPKSKKVKVIKLGDGKKKMVLRKKPKRIIINTQPQQQQQQPPKPQQQHQDKEPQSNYHDEFYSDVKGSGSANTLKTVKKPKRVEKYVDADGEHIHTYSEEHIHQIVYDEAPLVSGVQGSSPVPGLLPLDAVMPIPLVPAQSHYAPGLLAPAASRLRPVNSYGMPTTGSLGTPSDLEYMHYDPNDATHDHVIHEHGEMAKGQPASEIKFSAKPKATYDAQGVRLNPHYDVKKVPAYYGKGSWVAPEPPAYKPQDQYRDFSYYENLFAAKRRPLFRPRKPSNVETGFANFKDESAPIEYSEPPHRQAYYQHHQQPAHSYYSVDFKHRPAKRQPLPAATNERAKYIKSLRQHHQHKAAENKPYDSYAGSYQHQLNKINAAKYKLANNYKPYASLYDAASLYDPVEVYPEHKHVAPTAVPWRKNKKSKKSSISTQNISFGGQEHKMVINHETSIAIAGLDSKSDSPQEHAREPSPRPAIAYAPPMDSADYYMDASVPDASTTNFRIVAAPMPSSRQSAEPEPIVGPIPIPVLMTTDSPPPPTTTAIETPTTTATPPAPETTPHPTVAPPKKPKKPKKSREGGDAKKQPARPPRGTFKYGDRLNERYDYEYDDLVFI